MGFHFSLKTFRATTQRYYECLSRDDVGERMRPVTDKIDFMRRDRCRPVSGE